MPQQTNLSLAEQSVITNILIGEAEHELQRAKPEWFSSKLTRAIFEAAQKLYVNGREYGVGNIKATISKEALENADVNSFMLKLLDDYNCNIMTNAGQLDALEDEYRRAVAREACEQLADELGKEGEWHSLAEKIANKIMYSIAAVDDGVDLQEGMMEAIKQAENKQGKIFSTGFPIIDAQVGGLMTGAIAVIYAQEGMGKSALALNMVLNAQKINNAKILFVNTEEKWTATCGRVLANHEVVPVTAMIRGLNKNQATKAYDFAAGYKGGAFKLISSLSEPNDIRGYVAAEKSRGNKPDIVVLDNASYIGNGSPAEQAEDVSRLALDLALNHDVAVLLVAHSPKFEKDTAPSKSLVWGGKAISKSATAMFELRKAQGDMGGKVHRIDAHITKNRNGEEGLAVPLLFRGEQMKFEER